MKRTYRLRKPEHFQRVRRQGKTVSSPLLSLHVAASRRKGIRCGFVVSKHVGGAVERNRCKRRAREVVRLMLASITRGYDLVFVVRSAEVATVPFTTLQETIVMLLRRAQLWHEQAPSDTPQGR